MTSLLSNSKLLIVLLIDVSLIVLVLIVVAIVLLMQSRDKKKEKQAEAEPQDGKKDVWGERERTPGLAGNFREAMSRLRDRLSSWRERYDVPWYALVGETGSGKTTIADTLRGASGETVQNDASVDGAEYAPRWLLLDQAVLIDVPGAAFLGLSATDVPFGRRIAHTDRTAWRNFLRLCARYRPREPLNGIVLTISATELLAAVQEPDRPERVARMVEMGRRLDDIQHFTGLKLPVYVLVTKCDAVGGFESYSRIFCERAEGVRTGEGQDGIEANLFGWSNPYLLDTSYSPSWIDDAFDATNDVLLRYQLEMLAGSATPGEADDVMLFPFALQDLREPLRAVLDRIFRMTAYHGPHILRGIYFCGRENEEGTTEQPAVASFHAPLALLRPVAGQVIYIRHLFGFKVFAERFLASPVARGYFTRNRSVIAAQITACVLAIVLSASTFAAWVRLSTAVNHYVQPTLQMLATELDQIAIAPGSNMAPAVNVLNSLGESHVDELYSLAMPYSYVDLRGLHRRLHQVIQGSFEIVVLHSCHDALESRVYKLLSALPATSAGTYAASSYVPGTAWSADPAYRDLESYLASIATLETNIERYRFITRASSGSMTQLNHLLNYLGAYDLPDTSRFARDPNYRRVLLNAIWSPLALPSQFNEELEAAVNSRVKNFYASWFSPETSPLAAEVAWLRGADGLPLLSSVQAEPTNDQLRALVNHIRALDSQLNNGTYDWLSTAFQRESYPALGPEIDRMPLADSQFTAQIQAGGSSAVAALQDAVISGTPQIVVAGDGKVRMADDVRTLSSVLDALLNYEVMNGDSTGADSSDACQIIPDGYVWNRSNLQTALLLYQMRDKIDSDLIPEVPGNYRQAVAALVDHRAAANISLLLASAATPNASAVDAQSSMETELRNLGQSLGLLSQLEEDLSALHATRAESCLESSLTHQANTLLAEINRQLPTMFSPSAVVAPANLSTPVSLALYGFGSAADLQQYLATEQQKVETYAAEAAPLVRLLHSNGGHSTLLQRWNNISADVAALSQSKAGNPIQTLEQYISTDLDKVTPDEGCNTIGYGTSSDTFLNVQSDLARLAVKECDGVAVQRYNTIAAAFNRTLADRFPFSKTLDNRPPAEVSLDDIAAFYRTYDLYANGLETVLPGLVEDPDAVTAFLDSMQQVRPLVAGSPKDKTPSLVIVLHFRTNRNHEIYGDRIARWTVQIGQQSVSYPPAPASGPGLIWNLGDPVSATFRYAFDSPQLPSGANASPAAQTSGDTVRFQYTDPWSLYAMLRAHSAGPSDGADEYVFMIPNKDRQGTSATARLPDTIVYLRVQLLPAGSKPGSEPLPFPVFPYQAPAAQIMTVHGD